MGVALPSWHDIKLNRPIAIKFRATTWPTVRLAAVFNARRNRLRR